MLLHSPAKADLREIRDYTREHFGADAAERVRQHLQERILRLGKRPQLGIATSEEGIRVLSPTRYPYRIYFMNTSDVAVLHIRHTSRDLPPPGEFE